MPTQIEPSTLSPTPAPNLHTALAPTSVPLTLADFKFPASPDANKRYLFYLHGKIIEDQGIPAISPDFGEYEYLEILEKLHSYGFVVISEQRPKDTNGMEYASQIAEQVSILLNAGVPANHITVVGASKGAMIAIFVSHLLANKAVNFVILGICHPDVLTTLQQNQITLSGNVLSIYDMIDEYAGSCQELFSFSEGKDLAIYEEIVLNIGSGHGILYTPMDAWVLPTVQWADKFAD
jgi:hypothetical protein